ncbi:LysR substrate-binding domain-containing protein [Novosphingobium sp. NBM11]|uniref:LysR substrate-binding domain-containing protein n=1 Tax=Novosphingobium sp. NBM11 TaxID=2596914 RepID=UPI001892373D|nr:LysR substrate-binding domain-containing protein [Novosphingobium sp. NBM11]
MDLRQLRYLIALAEELNFTRAAARCNVSQPPFSRAIRDLETDIGARLFDRDKHRVALTAAGASMVEDARRSLAMIEEGRHRAQRTAAGYSGTLTFGFGGSTVYSLLPSLVAGFRRIAPDVLIGFRAMPVLNQIEALREGVIDIGILRLPVFDEMIATRFVYAEPLIVALPAGHPLLADSSAITIGQLASSPFVTYEPTRGFNFHADLLALCSLASFAPDIVHQAPTTEAVVGIVACGEGVAILPASAERLRMRGVSFRPLNLGSAPEALGSVRFGLAWRRGMETPIIRRFLEHVESDPALPLAG